MIGDKIIILILAVIIDLTYGEPPLQIHPVVICGKIASKYTKPYGSKAYGILLWIISVLPLLLLFYLLEVLTKSLNYIVYILISALILKTTFSIGLMNRIVRNAIKHIERGDLDSARKYIQELVRRDVYKLGEEHVLSACIESIAESLVDGVISPLFYYAFIGIPGAMLQRLANTMDSMVGYKTAEFKDIGWFSAKTDTLLNFIPARLTALMIVLSSILLGLDWKSSLRIMLRDHSKTESLNAGWPMSAMAGALRVQLEKLGHYKLGDRCKPISVEEVKKAIRVYNVVSLMFILILILIHLILL